MAKQAKPIPAPRGRIDRLLTQVVEDLKAGRNAVAVRRFASGAQHDAELSRHDLTAWLAETIGKAGTKRLIRAFATYPCMVCKSGLIPCEGCRGRGIDSRGETCESCVGVGIACCDFCAGSGLITHNFVPEGLRPAVTIDRSRIVMANASRLPALTGLSGYKAMAAALVRTNRFLAALDNAVGASREYSQSGLISESVLRRELSACGKAAKKLMRRVRAILSLLAKSSAAGSSHPEKGATPSSVRRRADFYRRLCESQDYTGTCLFHVNLLDLIAP